MRDFKSASDLTTSVRFSAHECERKSLQTQGVVREDAEL